jgi:hypothetical protein
MSGTEREGEEAGERAGAGGPRGPKSKLGRRVGLAVRLDWFFFLFLFKSIFKPFKFKTFSSFKTQILTQISPTILRLFENLLNNFSTLNSNFHHFF